MQNSSHGPPGPSRDGLGRSMVSLHASARASTAALRSAWCWILDGSCAQGSLGCPGSWSTLKSPSTVVDVQFGAESMRCRTSSSSSYISPRGLTCTKMTFEKTYGASSGGVPSGGGLESSGGAGSGSAEVLGVSVGTCTCTAQHRFRHVTRFTSTPLLLLIKSFCGVLPGAGGRLRMVTLPTSYTVGLSSSKLSA